MTVIQFTRPRDKMQKNPQRRMLKGMSGPTFVVIAVLVGSALFESAMGLGPALEPIASQVWRTELVSIDATSFTLGEPGMALGPDGKIFAVWDHWGELRFGELDNSVWLTSVLNGTGGTPSIAVDLDGEPHVAYSSGDAAPILDFSETDWNFMHAWREVGVWHHEPVDLDTDGGFSDIEVDATGTIHVAYSASEGTGISYGWKDTLGWHVESVATNGTQARDLALAADGTPHIVYFASRDPAIARVIHAYRPAGGLWVFEYVDAGARPSIAIDSLDRVHVAYGRDGTLRYAIQDTTGWSFELADEGPTAMTTSIALDLFDRPHIAYQQRIGAGLNDPCCGHLEYAMRGSDGTWLTSFIDREGLSGGATIRVDGTDTPRVLYYYFRDQVAGIVNYDLRYAEPLVGVPSRLN